MAGYVPPHLNGPSVANPVATPKVTKYTPPHLISCLNHNSVATSKADDCVPPHINESSSARAAITPTAPEYILPHLRGSTSTNSTAASKPAQNVLVHLRDSSVANSVTTPKASGCISPFLIASADSDITTPKFAGHIPPHLRATKPTQAISPPTLTNGDQDRSPSSFEKGFPALVKNADYVPPNLRSESDLKLTLLDSNIIDSAIPSKEVCIILYPKLLKSTNVFQCKPATPASLPLTQQNCKLACSWEEFTRGRGTVTIHVKRPDGQAANTANHSGTAISSATKPTQEKQDSSIDHSCADYTSTRAIMPNVCGLEKSVKPNPLTRDALIKISGAAPCESAISGVGQAVSDDGVDGVGQSQIDNDSCNNSAPTYVSGWRTDTEPDDDKAVDMKADEFTTGTSALCNKKILEPIQQQPSHSGKSRSRYIECFSPNMMECCRFKKHPEAEVAEC
jgi:hypothetical protein